MLDVKHVVLAYIADEVWTEGSADEVEASTNLVEEGILDSLGIFMVAEFLESRFGLKIDPGEISIDNFETLDAIADLVERALAAR